jgi:4-hydroxybenzoate polyprenyltransferase
VKKGAELLDSLFLLRPTLFFPVWTYFLAGRYGGARAPGASPHPLHPAHAVWIMAALSMLMGSVYILNQIQDMETDRRNRKLFLLANGIVPVRRAYAEAAVLAAASAGFAFWVDPLFGLGFVTLFLLAGILYNYPPTAWKNRPIPGIFVNGAGSMLIYDIGWVAGGGAQELPAQAFAYAFAVIAVFLNTTLPDRQGDGATGKVTFGVRYGLGVTAIWALAFEAGSFALSLILREWLLFIPSALALPFFVRAAVRRRLPDTLAATKFAVSALACAVCVAYPGTLIPIAAVFFLSRWYYRKRFGFDYPNFRAS